jgi:oxygen-independent coproporphyrinogen-3 oxidase
MIDAMINEIKLTKVSRNGENLEAAETIYFGGGTPSLLTIDELKKLLEASSQYFDMTGDAEITLEANPDDINEMKLREWKSIGINRFSIGIQSFKEEDLLWMNRAHNAKQALQCIKQVMEAGYKNFSVDLIYGTPTLTDEDWNKNVQTVIELDVPHISCYALTVEEKTTLHKMIKLKKVVDVDAEKQASQFLLLIKWLEAAGYEHYEISNFAKPGYRSKHNSSYWKSKSYIGIGPSAHSFNGTTRKWNINNNALYIQSLQQNIIPFEEEKLTEVQKLNEYIMTSLRTIEGIDLNLVDEKFSKEVRCKLEEVSKKYLHNYKLNLINNKLILTNEGKLFADGIAADLFFDENQLMIN